MTFANLPQTPNILVLVTDQQRAVQYFPETWVEMYMPNLLELQQTGITFTNAITNGCRCSPSRSMMWTGLYPPRTQVTAITNDSDYTTLDPSFRTLGDLLADTPYQVVYNGKWHLDTSFVAASLQQDPDIEGQDETMASNWGMGGWDAPDAGTTITASEDSVYSLGGGPNSDTRVYNDGRYTSDIETFLSAPAEPFFAVASLVNPHDVWTFLDQTILKDAFPEFAYYILGMGEPPTNPVVPTQVFDDLLTFFSFSDPTLISFLASYGDSLTTKPEVQTCVQQKYTPAWFDDTNALQYLQFYAYLNYLSDALMGRVVAAMSEDVRANTIVVRIADHGEVGMSHGGMMEKDVNAYRETINIPMVFSNPTVWPEPVTTDALIGLVDLAPTLTSIAGVESGEMQGTDFSTFLLNPSDTPPLDQMLFMYDDDYLWHVRAIQTADGAIDVDGDSGPYKYAVYYRYVQDGDSWQGVDPTTVQYELYDLNQDPAELDNLLPEGGGTASAHALDVQQTLHAMLTQAMSDTDNAGPGGAVTPSAPGQDPAFSLRPSEAVTPYQWPATPPTP